MFNNQVVGKLYILGKLNRLEVVKCPRLDNEVLALKSNKEHLHNSHTSEGRVSEARMIQEDTEDVLLFRKLTNEESQI